jgi:hypothetical protein
MRLLVFTLWIGACATGSTYRSGVGDKLLEHPPYYAGSTPAADTSRVAHLPVGYQRGSTQPPIFEPKGDAGTPIAAFLADLTAYLDSLGITTRLAQVPARGTPPDVRFSCEGQTVGSQEECTTGDGRDDIVMHLAVGRPSSDWVASAAAAMDSARAGSLLVITLEIGQYRVRQRGVLGEKDVELGTKHVVSIPWLTSLETPVQVLQLTGARIGRDGQAQRIGAEGILARRTSLPISAIGGQALISDAEVEKARSARREDLPGQPLAWQVALRELVRGLIGR